MDECPYGIGVTALDHVRTVNIETRNTASCKRLAIKGDHDHFRNNYLTRSNDVEGRTKARWSEKGLYFDAVALDDPLVDPTIGGGSPRVSY